MPDFKGQGPLVVTDQDQAIDMGFDAVLAGEKWEDPADAPKHIAPKQVESAPPLTATVSEALTEEGRAAAKALVSLPDLDYPALARLAREVAMDIKERHVILSQFKLTDIQYAYLANHNEFFKNALAAACVEWHAPLSTAERIRVEAAAILEDSLPGLGARMQNRAEGLPGVIEAAKLFAKVAGVGERSDGSAGAGERFVINIDLGGDTKISVSGEAAKKEDTELAGHSVLQALTKA